MILIVNDKFRVPYTCIEKPLIEEMRLLRFIICLKSRNEIHWFFLGKISIAELQARKDAFDETLERVEKQYFSYHPENVCKTIETVSYYSLLNNNSLSHRFI